MRYAVKLDECIVPLFRGDRECPYAGQEVEADDAELDNGECHFTCDVCNGVATFKTEDTEPVEQPRSMYLPEQSAEA